MTETGAVFDGSDDYIELTPWELGGTMTFEIYLLVRDDEYGTAPFVSFGSDTGSAYSPWDYPINNKFFMQSDKTTSGHFKENITVQYSTTNSNLYGSNTNQTIYASTSNMICWTWNHIVYTIDGYKQTTYFNGEKSNESYHFYRRIR